MIYEDFIDLANRNITSHDKFMWNCYGDDAYSMDSWDGNYDGRSISMVYDLKGLTVYQMSVYDFKNNRAYRYFNPDYKDLYFAEVEKKSADDIAWYGDNEDINYIDLEEYDDFVEKASAIMQYQDYDTRVSIPIDLPEEELLVIFKMAHEADMTFNDFVAKILREKLDDESFIQKVKALRHKLEDIHGAI